MNAALSMSFCASSGLKSQARAGGPIRAAASAAARAVLANVMAIPFSYCGPEDSAKRRHCHLEPKARIPVSGMGRRFFAGVRNDSVSGHAAVNRKGLDLAGLVHPIGVVKGERNGEGA